VLEHLMTRGQTVAGGDRIGKTIIFLPKTKRTLSLLPSDSTSTIRATRAHFARVVHHDVPYAQSLIDDFSNPVKPPHIAISVDMLDTASTSPKS